MFKFSVNYKYKDCVVNRSIFLEETKTDSEIIKTILDNKPYPHMKLIKYEIKGIYNI